MFRTSDIVLIAVMVVAAAFTYRTKHEAETEWREVRKIEQQIRTEEDTIDLLKADWSLLTQPSRLQRLAGTFQAQLQLQPIDAHQIVDFDDVPVRPVPTPDDASETADGIADLAQKDSTITGAVVQ